MHKHMRIGRLAQARADLARFRPSRGAAAEQLAADAVFWGFQDAGVDMVVCRRTWARVTVERF
jgi:hypothetical protein